jgi:hypothetical protein
MKTALSYSRGQSVWLRKSDPKYIFMTEEMLHELFDSRILAADLLSRSINLREHHAGWAVRETLITIKKELEGLLQ